MKLLYKQVLLYCGLFINGCTNVLTVVISEQEMLRGYPLWHLERNWHIFDISCGVIGVIPLARLSSNLVR